MSQRTEHPVFDGFITLWVFNPKRRTEITHSELLVYSALAHADCRHQILTNVDLSWRTGLDRNTVASALKSLKAKELIEDRTPLDRTDLFWKAKKANAEHWSQRIRFWKCLVRREHSKLKVTDQSVLSYVWWSKVTGFNPPKGWSERYVASIIKLTPETVEKAIARLEAMDLMRRDGNRWLVPKTLAPVQEAWFIRKSSGQSVKVVLGEFEPDIRKMADGYLPGGIVGITEAVSSRRPVDSILVYGEIGRLLGSEGSNAAARNRIYADAHDELSEVGTEGADWKPIIERHVQKHLASGQMAHVVAEAPSPGMSNEELAHQLQSATST